MTPLKKDRKVLIKLQNQLGKKRGKSTWIEEKLKQERINNERLNQNSPQSVRLV